MDWCTGSRFTRVELGEAEQRADDAHGEAAVEERVARDVIAEDVVGRVDGGDLEVELTRRPPCRQGW